MAAGRYPAILAVTSLNDTRVLYHEPAKWVARLRAVAPATDVLLKTEMGAGHGGPSGRYDAWKEEAFVLAWTSPCARRSIGPPGVRKGPCKLSAEGRLTSGRSVVTERRQQRRGRCCHR